MKIKLFVACEIQYLELGIFSFNSYVYYLTRGFIASTRAFNLLTCDFILPTRAFSLPTRAFNLSTRAFSVLTREFELVTRGFELVTRNSCFFLFHPVLANLFMGYHEKKWLQEFDKGKVLMYKRYVDDIFCMFQNEKDAEIFFEFLNCQHQNIKFTLEKENNKFLSFLDILIKNEGTHFLTSVYRKETLIGLFTHFNSFTPMSYKIGLVRCLIHRAFKISSSYIIFHYESEKVEILLQKKMYPKGVIDNQIKTFLDKQFTVDSGTTSEKQDITL